MGPSAASGCSADCVSCEITHSSLLGQALFPRFAANAKRSKHNVVYGLRMPAEELKHSLMVSWY